MKNQLKNWYCDFYSKPFSKVTFTDVKAAAKQLELLESLAPFMDSETKLFDQCCGDGTFATVASAAKKIKTIGIDQSTRVIDVAKRRLDNPTMKTYLPELEKLVTFKVADVLSYVEEDEFDIATCWHTSCAYSSVDSENIKQFECMSRSLKHGGFFIIDTINPVFVKKHFYDRKCRIEDDGTIVATWYLLVGNILSSTWKIASYNDDKMTTFKGMTKLYTQREYEKMLKSVGLEVIGCLGDYEGHLVNDELGRMILFGVNL